MKAINSIILCIGINFLCFSQVDTIIVRDYTLVMVSPSEKGEIEAITSLDNVTQAGLFLHEYPEGKIRICNSSQTYIWVNGKLFTSLEGCELFNPKDFYQIVDADTLYLSFSSLNGLSDLKCELIVFEELHVIKDDPREVRETTNDIIEFLIVSVLILLLLIGFITINHPGRINYLFRRTFTFKTSAYEFVNTGFITTSGISMLTLLSLLLGFYSLYLSELFGYYFFDHQDGFYDLVYEWIFLSSLVFLLIFIKWTFISIVARLFHFREIHNYQLFDFTNFYLFMMIPIFLFTVIDFVINPTELSWIGIGFTYVFPTILILFIIWFTLKFVNNSPRKKLLIFSYLCATEIIPAILVFGWFYK